MKREHHPKKVEHRPVDDRANDSLLCYLKEISRYPLLDQRQEEKIGRDLATLRGRLDRLMGRPDANGPSYPDYNARRAGLEREMNQVRNRLVTSNLRLVVSIAKRFRNTGLTLLDLINEGNLGLIHAAERFDYTKGCRFSTYATWWVRQAIEKAIAESGRTIRIPAHVIARIRRIERVTFQYIEEHGSTPPLSVLSEAVCAPETKVKTYLSLYPDAASLDMPVEDQEGTTLAELQSRPEYEEPIEWVFQSQVQSTFISAFRVLDTRERRIVSLRYGLGGSGPLTLEEIGNAAGITRERVRQLLNLALDKLRDEPSVRELELQR